MRPWVVVYPLGLWLALVATGIGGEIPSWVGRTIDRLPRTLAEAAAAHALHEDDCCEVVRPGQPLSVPEFSLPLQYVVGEGDQRRTTEYLGCRRPVIALGTRMEPEDQAGLPRLTADTILEHVNDNFVCLQVRIHKNTADGEPYLHDKPHAAVSAYGKSTSKSFTPLVRNSVRDVRSLGLVIDSREPVGPKQLRTLALIFKSSLGDEQPGSRTTPRSVYEMIFVRCRVVPAAAGGESSDVQLHAFATSHDRRRLHVFPAFEPPTGPDTSHIRSTIYFTRYGLTGLNPVERAVRRAEYRSAKSFEFEALDRHAEANGHKGGALANLSWVLDEIIDGRAAAMDGNVASNAGP